MPANLTPQYIEAERKFRAVKTLQEKIKYLEEMMATVPKHKGTEKLQALLKTKMAKLKAALQARPAVTRRGPGFHVERSGAGQVAVIGPPNSGKSRLIAALTGAQPEIGDYPYTTRFPSPYMMKFENVRVQLIDTPPLSPEDIETEVIELAKTADGILFVLNLADQDTASTLEIILAKLKEKRLELVPELACLSSEPGRFVKKTLFAANKCEVEGAEENFVFLREYFGDKVSCLAVSAARGDGLEELRPRIFFLLDVVRVYSKIPGKKPDLNDPFALKKGSTVIDMARAVHKDFVDKFKFARVWRKNSLQVQMVNRDFVLEDGDIVELRI